MAKKGAPSSGEVFSVYDADQAGIDVSGDLEGVKESIQDFIDVKPREEDIDKSPLEWLQDYAQGGEGDYDYLEEEDSGTTQDVEGGVVGDSYLKRLEERNEDDPSEVFTEYGLEEEQEIGRVRVSIEEFREWLGIERGETWDQMTKKKRKIREKKVDEYYREKESEFSEPKSDNQFSKSELKQIKSSADFMEFWHSLDPIERIKVKTRRLKVIAELKLKGIKKPEEMINILEGMGSNLIFDKGKLDSYGYSDKNRRVKCFDYSTLIRPDTIKIIKEVGDGKKFAEGLRRAELLGIRLDVFNEIDLDSYDFGARDRILAERESNIREAIEELTLLASMDGETFEKLRTRLKTYSFLGNRVYYDLNSCNINASLFSSLVGENGGIDESKFKTLDQLERIRSFGRQNLYDYFDFNKEKNLLVII